MKKTVLELVDEVNCRFHNLDITTRRKLSDELSYFLPYAFHTPAYKLGRWDGKIKFCDIGARTYINLLDRLIPIVQDSGYEIELVDNRVDQTFQFEKVDAQSYSDRTWPEGHRHAGEPIVLRDYQVEIVNEFFKHPQGIQEISTGAGKTLVTAVLSHRVEPYGRSIVIVPSKQLVEQTEADYINMGLDVGVLYGDRKEYTKTHTICTWQSLEALNKKSKNYDPDISLADFIEDVACIIVDEAHGGKADVLKKLMTREFAHIPLRWGMTGTIPLEEHEKISLILSIGEVINEVTAAELQAKGVLAKLHVEIMQLKDPVMKFTNYHSELKWIEGNMRRMEWIAKHIQKQSEEGNTLVLVQHIKAGELLRDLIPDSVFISGKVKTKDRKEEYDEVKTAAGKIIIATYGVAAVGIDVPRIFNLYMLEPGKSFIRVIQSIGRSIRMADDKDFANVFDLTSTHKYSKRHLTTRKKYYRKQEYPFTVKKVDYL
jgi:superfamily II DNA or RNA helicase